VVASKLEPHEIALRYPWSEEACASMAKDIERDGQREAIVLYEGKILDGRHRYEACMRLGRQPRTREFGSEASDGSSPTRFAHSMNVERRHVDKAVLAALVVDSVDESARAEAKARMAEGGKAAGRGRPQKGGPLEDQAIGDVAKSAARTDAVSLAAAEFGVSRSIAYRAQAVKREAPEVFEQVKAGKLSVYAAEREAGIATPKQPESKPEPEAPKSKPRREAPDAKGAPLHERSYLDPELRARVVELLGEGRSQSEVASILEFGDAAYLSGAVGGFKRPSDYVSSKVSQIRRDLLPVKADPLESLIDAVEAVESDFKSWCSSFEPKWRTATPAQADRLRARVDAMVSSARRFVSQLNKEIQS
jgi:hypothetical protein